MPTWIILLLSCTNSGLGQTSTGDTATSAACPWVGEWELASIKCGGSFAYEDFDQVYDSAVMEISQGAGGVCEVEFTWSAEECAETEAWELTPLFPEEDTVQWQGETDWKPLGITDCSPSDCTVDTSPMDKDPVQCEEGDRESSVSYTVKVDGSTEGQITITDMFADGGRGPSCGLSAFSTTWAKKD